MRLFARCVISSRSPKPPKRTVCSPTTLPARMVSKPRGGRSQKATRRIHATSTISLILVFSPNGNARLVFDGVYIERSVPTKPKSETRTLRSVFTPKAAAILRALLREPDRPWLVTDLARIRHQLPAADADALALPGLFCTSPIVTYLDLWCGNDREREAADHLASEALPWIA